MMETNLCTLSLLVSILSVLFDWSYYSPLLQQQITVIGETTGYCSVEKIISKGPSGNSKILTLKMEFRLSFPWFLIKVINLIQLIGRLVMLRRAT